MKDIFISYAREEEKDFANPLAVALSDLNIILWIDIKEGIVGHELLFINEHEKNNELKRTKTN